MLYGMFIKIFQSLIFFFQILKRGVYINDRDGFIDMILLYYVSKLGVVGIGDVDLVCRMVIMFLGQGVDFNIRCRWINMIVFYYVVYFDVVFVIKVFLKYIKVLGKVQFILYKSFSFLIQFL